MKKSIIIWITAIILVLIAVYTTKNFNAKPEVVINPPQQNLPAEQPTPTPSPAEPDNSGQQGSTKVNLMEDYDFELEDLKGNKVSLRDYKGKKVFLNFWATSCPPCKAEMPDIEKLYQETKDKDLVILAVNVGEDKRAVQSFLEANGYNFPVLLDIKGEVSQLYQVTWIPTSLFIDTKGYLGEDTTGALSLEAMKEFVNNLE